ncbi:hypothetical protein [Desulfosporosinus orientis]|uniref:hypothetical protein n=1 Tax=Desulfosporosinus orientis TaxID=1563 RepID=UPI0005A5D4EA|nr:hypothetical protein [Desulfosporosinus orientis]
MHGEAVQTTSGCEERGAMVNIRYYPGVWHESVRLTFSLEAAISKEYLSAEDSSRSREWASLRMLINLVLFF